MDNVPGPESTASLSPSQANLEAFRDIFPGVVQDGVLDAARLGEALGIDVAGLKDGKERFGLMWAGKHKAVEALQAPSYAALIPDMENSVNWDAAENVFIEGDNLEVLKLLQNAYNDQVKLIYIDPPYNTGNDFVYNDDFSDPIKHYLEVTGQVDGDGNKLVANTEVSGRKHSNWLTMMYPRLVLARNLLTQDGAIFISIDDNEVHNLRLLMDEIFGPENFVACITWHKTYSTRNDAQEFSKSHEYMLVYKRAIWARKLLPRGEKSNAMYKFDDQDGRGPYRTGDLTASRTGGQEPEALINPLTGKSYYPPAGASWRHSPEKLAELLAENRIYWGRDGHGAPQLKRYLSEVQDGVIPTTIWHYDEVGHTDKAAKEVKELLGGGVFDYPKPVDLIRRVIQLGMGSDGIVMDFFGGSGTTGQAVMQANKEDGGSRKYVLVTLDEPTDEKSNARLAGYLTVSQITLERLRRAAEKLDVDHSLRVMKVGKSNFKLAGDLNSGDQIDFSETTLLPEAEGIGVASQISLSLGELLSSTWGANVGASDVWKIGSTLIATGMSVAPEILSTLQEEGCSTLAVLEDAFQGRDDLKANLYFACKKANIAFKTF